MRREAGRKRWIGLVLIIILCLTGVYGAGITENIPVYTFFSCAAETGETAAPASGQSGEQGLHGVSLPVQRLCQNSFICLPDAARPTERLQQSRPDLLSQGRPGRRGFHRFAVETDGAALAELPQPAEGYGSRENMGRTVILCGSRIISYIHDQDGQKDNIL